MYHIRTTKTGSKAKAVQIVSYQNRKMQVHAHIGSAHDDNQYKYLQEKAQLWINTHSEQKTIFDFLPNETFKKISSIEKCKYLGVDHSFAHEVFKKILAKFKFTSYGNSFLEDLIIIRIIEPASKLYSLKLLEKYFGVKHRRQRYYEELNEMLKLKNSVEKLVTQVAQKEFGFDFTLVFYDVTTLYFESFDSDDLRKTGFSKDGKSNQPQIVIGLVVNNIGFPVASY